MGRSVAVLGVVLGLACLVGCGSESPRTYDAGRSLPSLEGVGWIVRRGPGTPETATGARQVDYLETTAPDRRRFDLQFFESPASASAELAALRERDPRFPASTIGNVLVIPVGEDPQPVPGQDLDSLRDRLRT